jgi:hypothetical protein
VRLVRVLGLPALAAVAFLGAWWLFESVLGADRGTAQALAGMILAVVSIGQSVWAGYQAPAPAGQPGTTRPVGPPSVPPYHQAPAAIHPSPTPPPIPTGPGLGAPPPASPESRPQRRPGPLSAACGLLYSNAVLLLASAVILAGSAQSYADDFAAPDVTDQSLHDTGMAVVIVTVVLDVLIAVAMGLLGLFVGRGSDAARIITFVLAGLLILCYGFSLALDALISMSGPDASSQVDDAIPDWQITVSTGTTVILFAAMFAVILLLALPSSNQYFRNRSRR